VASTSKVFSMGHINQLTWVPAANTPSPLKWKFEILPPVYDVQVEVFKDEKVKHLLQSALKLLYTTGR